MVVTVIKSVAEQPNRKIKREEGEGQILHANNLVEDTLNGRTGAHPPLDITTNLQPEKHCHVEINCVNILSVSRHERPKCG
jgi:hypothetical protein